MMESDSRYYHIETASYTDPAGEEILYLRRRFLPRGEEQTLLVEIQPVAGDRLDLISNRYLGAPLAFWRICDANNALNPFDLLNQPKTELRITIPEVENG